MGMFAGLVGAAAGVQDEWKERREELKEQAEMAFKERLMNIQVAANEKAATTANERGVENAGAQRDWEGGQAVLDRDSRERAALNRGAGRTGENDDYWKHKDGLRKDSEDLGAWYENATMGKSGKELDAINEQYSIKMEEIERRTHEIEVTYGGDKSYNPSIYDEKQKTKAKVEALAEKDKFTEKEGEGSGVVGGLMSAAKIAGKAGMPPGQEEYVAKMVESAPTVVAEMESKGKLSTDDISLLYNLSQLVTDDDELRGRINKLLRRIPSAFGGS